MVGRPPRRAYGAAAAVTCDHGRHPYQVGTGAGDLLPFIAGVRTARVAER